MSAVDRDTVLAVSPDGESFSKRVTYPNVTPHMLVVTAMQKFKNCIARSAAMLQAWCASRGHSKPGQAAEQRSAPSRGRCAVRHHTARMPVLNPAVRLRPSPNELLPVS